MTIVISIKDPVPHETDIIGLKEALASLTEQHNLTVDRIDIQEAENEAI